MKQIVCLCLLTPKDVANPAWGAGETSSLWWEREWDLHGSALYAADSSIDR